MFAFLTTALLLSCEDELLQRTAALKTQGFEVIGLFNDSTIRSVTLRSEIGDTAHFVGLTTTGRMDVALLLHSENWVKTDTFCVEGQEVRSVFTRYLKRKVKA